MQEKEYYLGFSLCSGIGSKRFAQLLKHFETAKNAWFASENDLKTILGETLAKRVVDFRNTCNLPRYIQKLSEKKVQFFIPSDSLYPPLLKSTQDIPTVLYVLGDASVLLYPKAIGVVGTRKVSSYGEQVTTMLTKQLVEQDFVIVSGLAIGVDTIAHKTAVEHNGKTVAVVGCGVDICVPAINKQLYDIIYKKSGCIVSTFPLGLSSSKGLFPARNKTIAGLSLGVLVTEGTEDSGALITANYAVSFARPVFAVPGPITSGLSGGTNTLLKRGAIAVSNACDIITTFGYLQKTIVDKKKHAVCSREEKVILSLLENGPLHFDQIVAKMGHTAKSIGSILGLMEIKGLVKQQDGEYTV